MLSKVKNFLLDTLFPISCLSCNKPDVWLCDSCLEKIPSRLEQSCPACEKQITPDGRVCFGCRKKSALDALLVASHYRIESVSQSVHCFKYHFVEELRIPLGKILLESFLGSQLPLPDFIIPVPLHKRRLRWRGFNQAELLANYLSENLTPGFEILVLNNLLTRQKYTRPQMEIKNYFRRRENLKDAFTIADTETDIKADIKKPTTAMDCDRNLWQPSVKLLRDKTILLVDDIATTGSTLFECAKALKQNGAKEVFAVVVARQEYGKK